LNNLTQKTTQSNGVVTLFYACVTALLFACGPTEEAPTSSFTIGGTVSGLSDSGRIVVQNNEGDALAIDANGPFSFAISSENLTSYSVTTVTQPTNPNQICTIQNGSGNFTNENITNIEIVCITTQYSVNGTVSGLADADSLTLQNNEGDDITITENGEFTFATAHDHLTAFDITVLSQPTTDGSFCVISNANGLLDTTTVIDVVCSTNTFSLSGTVSGLSNNGSFVLQNNAGDDLAISTNGSFTFATPLVQSDTYSVAVIAQPSNPDQECTINNASGTITNENITDVSVSCSTTQFPIELFVGGLANGATLTVQNNGGNNLSISANGHTEFLTEFNHLSDYDVTILTQPVANFDQTCEVVNPTGTLEESIRLNIACIGNLHSVNVTVSGLHDSATLELENNRSDGLTITENGTYSFADKLFRLDDYTVRIEALPESPDQTCTFQGPYTGIMGTEDIDDISVTCAIKQYGLSGSIEKLNGTGLVLQNNLGNDLLIEEDANSFSFANSFDDLSAYSVTVLMQPTAPMQTCSVTNDTGSFSGAPVTDVTLTCSTTLHVSTDDLYATDAGTGIPDEPFKTISAAISFAKTLNGPVEIKVAEGLYEVEYNEPSEITMTDGVSLYGGYSSLDWDVRDATSYPSIITDIGTDSIYRTISYESTVTNTTVLDGFTLNLGTGTSTNYGIYTNRSSPIISNNIINGTTGSKNYGIHIPGGSPIIFGNTINGGTPDVRSYGINIDANGITASSAVIFNNKIFGGSPSGGEAIGITISGLADITIYNNIISAGNAPTKTQGVRVNGSKGAVVDLYNNTVSGGSGNDAYGVVLVEGATATMNNNILFTEGGATRYCIYEYADILSNVTVLNNNNIYDCTTALFQDDNRSVTLTNINDVETDITDQGFAASGNVSTSPGFLSATNWHFGASSLCSVARGGKDGATLSWIYSDDNEGTTRTGNGTTQWSMGAYEYDGACQ